MIQIRRLAVNLGMIAILQSLLLQSVYAQANQPLTAGDENKSLVGEPSKVAANTESENEVLQTIPADITRVILKQFRLDNPDAREHKIALISEAFTEDASNPALKLERMWVSSKSTLLEITGLQRQGQPNSAAIAPQSLRLVNAKTSQAAKLVNFDGVQQVLDRRGGKVLILKPGDSMYLQFEAVDDLQALSLNYTGWDNREAKYFDRIDPRFKDRYDAAYKLASESTATPENMKDFLVEFARQDPDKKAPVIFMSLINKMRVQNTFEGYYQAYLLVKDPSDAKAAFKLVRNDEHRAKMEAITIATLADKSRLIDINLQLNPSNTKTSESDCAVGGLLGLFGVRACKYNFTANRAINGYLTVQAKQKGAPIKLSMGTYKVSFSRELTLPRWGIQESNYVGNFNRRSDEKIIDEFSVILSPPSYSASLPINFGSLDVVFFQRGVLGGYTSYYADGDALATVRFKSMELIK